MRPIIPLLLALTLYAGQAEPLPQSAFTDVTRTLPATIFDLRYSTGNNFIGSPIDGYDAPRCYLTHEAAAALAGVQKSLASQGQRLRIFDCFRPQRAVDHFVRWARDLNDTKMKRDYYPNVEKKDLFRDGYIAEHSGHSRGSTVDLTIDGLDMGTPFDFFDPRSHTDAEALTPTQHANRMALKAVMEANGFSNYPEEWWHFTLKHEPFKERYFDFCLE